MPKHLRLFSLLIFTLLPIVQLAACKCAYEYLVDRISQSEFVARIAINSVQPDPNDKDYHLLEITLLESFKGAKPDTLRVHSRLTSSCAFLPKENTEWLVFASRWKGRLSFGYCSGSKNMATPSHFYSSRAAHNYQQSLHRKLNFLRTITGQGITVENEYELGVKIKGGALDAFKGMDGNVGDFSLFQYEVRPNLSIRSRKVLIPFRNAQLAKKVNKMMRKAGPAVKWKVTSIPETTYLHVALFYYAGEGDHPSFISFYDL
ncbi:hypothetical protein QWY85_02955 [Neolewinella lacunae]|uniref:Uncharacterized protein n=1 Tax=Neolewinella lacunae TaxID=1517758 RepID=A0A923TAF9_9BACT|nr:hypothetical protein [Neolewinella lacunae]MBC6996459.1 hypothetical protein [Neolewinella lacunae]MDN3633598.1 hypothetical protein [Neolewinella lacunae]